MTFVGFTSATRRSLGALQLAVRHGRDLGAAVGLRQGGLLAAMILMALAFLSPFASLRSYLFSVDMTQHVVLTALVAPLLLLGRPAFPAVVISAPRRAPGRAAARFERAVCWLIGARPALAIYLAITYVGFIPAVYEAALYSEPLHVLLHSALLAGAVLFWRPLLGPGIRLRPGWALLYLGAAVVAQSKALAGLLVVIDRPIYVYYAQMPRIVGLSALDDQQVAAGVLGIGSVLSLGLAICVTFVGWLRKQDQEQAAREAAEDVALAASHTSGRR